MGHLRPHIVVSSLLLGLLPFDLLAADVVLVRSGVTPAQNAAVAGFKQGTITGDLQIVDVKGVSAFEPGVLKTLRDAPPKVFVALGVSAARACAASGLPAKLVYGFVPAADADGLDRAGSGGILAEVPVATVLLALQGFSATIHKVGVLYSARGQERYKEIEKEGRKIGLTVIGREIAGPTTLPSATRGLLGEVDALAVLPDEALESNDSLAFVLRAALEASKPAISFSEQHFSLGALIAVVPDPEAIGGQLADLSNRALRGESNFEGRQGVSTVRVSVNVRACKNIGIPIETDDAELDGNLASKIGPVRRPPPFGTDVPQVASAPPVSPADSAPTETGGEQTPVNIPADPQDQEPQVVEMVNPVYPPLALKQRREGQVVVEVTVGMDGTVAKTRVIKGSSLFNDAAVAAVKQYKFVPAQRAGQPVEGMRQVTITFKL